MSREIKFRAWDDKGKYWYPAETIIDFFNYLSEKFTIIAGYFNKDAISLEQYTGLKDKNGKEIYEGDIFRNTINGGTWRVYWNENDASFWVDSGVSGCSLGEFDWDESNRQYGFISKNCEVIGNIHENGGSLKGGEE